MNFQENQMRQQQQEMQALQILKNSSIKSKIQQIMKPLQNLQLSSHIFPITVTHSLKILTVFHMALTFVILDSQTATIKIQDIQQFINSHIILYRTSQFSLYLLKVVIILAISLVMQRKANSLLQRFANTVAIHANILIESDLLITSFFLIANFKENILSFIISAMINLTINIVFDRFTNRRQQNYEASQTNSVIYQCVHILLLLANSIFALIGIVLYYYIFNIIMGVLILTWYLTSGINLYLHSKPTYYLKVFVSMHTTFVYLLTQRIILNTDIFSMNNLIQYALIFSFCFYFLLLSSEKYKYKLISHNISQISNIKKIELLWFNEIRSNSFQYEDASFLAGLFESHQTSVCSNPKCFTHHSNFYDPINKTCYNLTDVSKEIESNMRFYLKCIYEQCLQTDWNVKLLLDYCEFLVCQYFDLYLISGLLAKIDLERLNFFDSLRLYRLKIAVNKEANATNQLIFDGKLQIERVIKADIIYQGVIENINRYLKKSIIVWTAINRSQVNLISLTQSFKKLFKVLEQIDSIWATLTPEFILQKKWKALRIKYSHFILNNKVRQRDNQGFKISEEGQQRHDVSYIEPNRNTEKLLNKELLFDKNTMYIQTAIQNKVMYMIRTNKRFQEISHYCINQLKGVSLDYFLPEDVRIVHNNAVMAWLENGQTNNQASYPIRFTELINKEGQVVPVIKYFKIIFNAEASREDYLHFICMLKANYKNDLSQQQPLYANRRKQPRISDMVSEEEEDKIENPFLKEEHLQPNKMMVEVSRIKKVLRVLITILVFNTIGLAILTYQDASDLNSYSIQYINFLNLYRYPMAFGKNILKTMLNVGNQTKTIDQIHSQSAMMSKLMSDPMTLQSIFDNDLNIPKMYYPFQNNSFNNGIGYDQIDLIYYMVSTMQSLNQLPANRTGEYFTNFNMYITSYDALVNSTKIRFHDSFKGIFGSMSTNQQIFLIIGIFIFVSSIIFVIFQAYQYFQKTKEIIKTVISFDQKDIKKIISYFKKLQYSLCNVIDEQTVRGRYRQDSYFSIPKRRRSTTNLIQKEEVNLNKRNKYIYQLRKNNMYIYKRTAMVVILIVAMMIGTCGFEVTNMITIDKIFSFQEDGFYFLRYFPATSVLGHAILEKYYSQLYPQEITFYPKRYIQSITDLSLIARTPYIGEVLMPDSDYFQNQKNYLFGNPCTFKPSVLVGAQTTQAKCLSIYNNTFSMGITTFLRACEDQVNNFLNGQIKLSSSQVDELTVALTLVAYYITDAIMTWSSELTEMIMSFNSNTFSLCISICIGFLLLHFAFCEKWIFPYLENDYRFNRSVYERMVPQQILIFEKVTKQKFIINGILRH